MIPAMGVLAGGEEGVGEFQGVKSYLWVALLSVGGDQRGAGGGSSERRRWRRRVAAVRQGVAGAARTHDQGGAGARRGAEQGGTRAARGERQHGGGDGAMNKHGNSWNAMERGEHELQRVERCRF